MTTENLGLTELVADQSQPHVPVNLSLRLLDAICQLRAIDKDLNAPPGGTTAGRVYIVGPSPTGLWSGHANEVAYYSGGWVFFVPTAGVLAYVTDEDTYYRFSAGSPEGWEVFSGGGGGSSLSVINEDSPAITILDVLTLIFEGFIVTEESGGIARIAIPTISVPVTSVAGRTGDVLLTAEDLTDLGSANGAASLDGGGKVPLAQLPSSIVGAVSYQGTWNANTNSPDLGASSPTQGMYYVVSTAGVTSLGGISEWAIGDWAIYNGSAWEKVDNSEAVTSVAARTGAVVITSADLADFVEAAQDAVGGALTDSSTIDFTYNDGAGTMTAIVIDDSITYAKMQNVSATQRLLGRNTAGAGDPEEVTPTQVVAMLKTVTPCEFQIACSDLATALTTGDRKAVFRAPFAFTLLSVRASLAVTSSSGLPTADVNKNGSTALSTKITIDVSELTSTTAATPPVVTGGSVSFADDDEISVDLDVAGTGAKGLIVTLIGTRA